MPAYITKPQSQQVSAIYPGDAITLVNNAATDANITTTLQFAVGPVPGNSVGNIVIVNSTNQTATGQYCTQEVLAGGSGSATYEPLSSCTVPTLTSLPYNLSGGWVRFTFTTAPTSGSLIVSR